MADAGVRLWQNGCVALPVWPQCATLFLSVPEGMGMWQTLGLGHLGQPPHFLSSINRDDGA